MLLFEYPFMLPALGLCLLLSGLLGVFGHHVVRRGVIFVDLALAQMAALGAAVSLLVNSSGAHGAPSFAVSVGATLLGALLFAWFRRWDRLPIEAMIGITYAGAMAFTLLILERSATGTEELKEMLVGSILTVDTGSLAVTAAVFAAVAVILAAARRPLFHITEDPAGARSAGRRIALWDLLFYSLFGVVVTLSVHAAGILLVFAFLVTPSLASLLVAERAWARLLFGWGFGVTGCVVGLETSLRLDASAGPTVAATFIVLLAITGAVSTLTRARSPRPTRPHA